MLGTVGDELVCDQSQRNRNIMPNLDLIGMGLKCNTAIGSATIEGDAVDADVAQKGSEFDGVRLSTSVQLCMGPIKYINTSLQIMKDVPAFF